MEKPPVRILTKSRGMCVWACECYLYVYICVFLSGSKAHSAGIVKPKLQKKLGKKTAKKALRIFFSSFFLINLSQ